MPTYLTLLMLLSVSIRSAISQIYLPKSYHINNSIFEFPSDSLEVNEVLVVLDSFIRTKDSVFPNPLWDSEDLAKFPWPYVDLINYSKFYGTFDSTRYENTLLQFVKTYNPDGFIAKMAMGTIDPSGSYNFLYIYNFYVMKTTAGHKIRRYTDLYCSGWNHINRGKLNFIIMPGIKNRKYDILRMSRFNKKMSKLFGQDKADCTLYVMKTCKQVMEARGYEYIENMYFAPVGGWAESYNKCIFAGINSCWYPHELVHLYTSRVQGSRDSWNYIADEGIATYFGGSSNLSLKYHLGIVHEYVKVNDKSSLVELCSAYRKILHPDKINTTNTTYAISGMIASLVFKRSGIIGLNKLLYSGRTAEDFLDASSSALGIKRDLLDTFLRQELEKYGS